MKQLIIFNLSPEVIKYAISTDIDFTPFNDVYINGGISDQSLEKDLSNILYDADGDDKLAWIECEQLATLDVTDLTAIVEIGFLV